MSDPLTGTLLDGRYRVCERVGKGGMGVVYRAEHSFLRRPLAVKVLNPSFSADAARVERFFREAQAASSIRHANVVEILDVGYTPDGAAYFVMEHLVGEDLATCLAHEGRLPWRRARSIALQVCSAMQQVHRGGIIHRDLKPDNIFLVRHEGAPELVKLLDFGIAKVSTSSDDDPLTRTGEVFGTPGYMAPEHLNGDPLDERADIYALGVILYKMLTGQVPFRGRDPMQILGQILLHDAPTLHAGAPDLDLPAELDAALRRAMRRDRDARFPTMDALARALAAIPPEPSRPANPSRRTTPPEPAPPRPVPTRVTPSQPAPPLPTITRSTPPHPTPHTPVERALTDLLTRPDPDTAPTARHGTPASPRPPPRHRARHVALLLPVAALAATLLLQRASDPIPSETAILAETAARPTLAGGLPFSAGAPQPTQGGPSPPAAGSPQSTRAPPDPALSPAATASSAGAAPAAPARPAERPVATNRREPPSVPVARPRPVASPPAPGVDEVLAQVDRAVNLRCQQTEGAYPGMQIDVELKILASGRLARAALPARIRDEPLGECVLKELRRATFPAVALHEVHRIELGPE